MFAKREEEGGGLRNGLVLERLPLSPFLGWPLLCFLSLGGVLGMEPGDKVDDALAPSLPAVSFPRLLCQYFSVIAKTKQGMGSGAN